MDIFIKKYVTTQIIKELNKIGIKPNVISNYKTGRSKPKPKKLVHICFVISVYTNIHIDDLIYDAVQHMTGDIQ